MKRLLVYDLCYSSDWKKAAEEGLSILGETAHEGSVIYIRMEKLEGMPISGRLDSTLTTYLFDLIRDLFPRCPVGHKTEKELLILVFHRDTTEDTERNVMIEKCHALYERLNVILGLTLRIGIGGRKMIEDLPVSLDEAKESIDCSNFPVIHYEDIHNDKGSDEQTSAAERALRYMEANYFRPLSLELVSRAVYVSPSYLSAILREETGKSYITHLTELRLAEAKRLLKSTTLSAKEIGQQVGYQDMAYFNRLFKRQSGLTPGEYRSREKPSKKPMFSEKSN